MKALIEAAPEALRYEKGKNSAAAKFPEFRAWHALLEPLFGMTQPDWTEKPPMIMELPLKYSSEEENATEEDLQDEEGEQEGDE